MLHSLHDNDSHIDSLSLIADKFWIFVWKEQVWRGKFVGRKVKNQHRFNSNLNKETTPCSWWILKSMLWMVGISMLMKSTRYIWSFVVLYWFSLVRFLFVAIIKFIPSPLWMSIYNSASKHFLTRSCWGLRDDRYDGEWQKMCLLPSYEWQK